MAIKQSRPQMQVEDLQRRLVEHPLYRSIDDTSSLKIFMEHHVFCVWDFQSLLTMLQRIFTCVRVPWIPTDDPMARRLINEVVLDEESDEIEEGVYMSHFEYYLESMVQLGASTAGIEGFLDGLRAGASVNTALNHPAVPRAARDFVATTFNTIESGCAHEVASVFAFGRENLIPEMFPRLQNLALRAASPKFAEYLERHIEYDGERHGPLSEKLVESQCGDDPILWAEARRAARNGLMARITLWDRVHETIVQNTEPSRCPPHRSATS